MTDPNIIKEEDLDHEYLCSILKYDEEISRFKWLIKKGSCGAGKVAGFIHLDGYRMIKINKKCYLEHRLVWFYFHKKWPVGFLDHVNGDGFDNRIENLREATNSQNMGNRKINKNTKSKFKGVSYFKLNGKYVARIQINGKRITLGYFDEESDAYSAYCKAADKHFGEYANYGGKQ